jgi:hypothetical protein
VKSENYKKIIAQSRSPEYIHQRLGKKQQKILPVKCFLMEVAVAQGKKSIDRKTTYCEKHD